MKSAYAIELQRKKLEREAECTKGGFDFAMMLVAVALNNIDGFGKDRLEALEKECQRLMDEEFGPDPEAAAIQLAHRLQQIKDESERRKSHEKA